MATNSEPGGKLGRNPCSSATASGLARRIWTRKQPPIVTTRARITASIFLIPNRWSQSSRNVSSAVTTQPQSKRHAEQELQGDHRTDHLGQVARGDGDLGQDPEREVHRPGILRPAGLRQVVPGDHPQPCREGLEHHRHQVRHQEDPEQGVAEPGPALQVGRPVPRVHVADAHQIRRPQEREQPLERVPLRDPDRAMHLAQRLPTHLARIDRHRPPPHRIGASAIQPRFNDISTELSTRSTARTRGVSDSLEFSSDLVKTILWVPKITFFLTGAESACFPYSRDGRERSGRRRTTTTGRS